MGSLLIRYILEINTAKYKNGILFRKKKTITQETM